MSGSLQNAEAAFAELDSVAFLDRDVRELSSGTCAEINLCACVFGKLAMSRDKVGVNVRFDNVPYFPAVGCCGTKIDVDIPLRVDHRGHASRRDHIRGMRKTAEIKSLNVYRLHPVLLN
jgi:hypothetical protein